MTETPKIVIAGFGDTGLLVAAHLKDRYAVTAISTKPLLVSGQELGSRLSRLSEWKANYLLPFDRLPALENVNIIHGKVLDFDPDAQSLDIERSNGEQDNLGYDVLVIASGTRNGFWRTDVVQSTTEIEAELAAQADQLEQAGSIAIIGGGPTGVSTASNLKEIYPDKDVQLYYRQDLPLSGYHDKTRKFVAERLAQQGVQIHPSHCAVIPDDDPLPVLQSGTVSFTNGPKPIIADCILWATGQIMPHNGFIPNSFLNYQGYVTVNPYFQTPSHSNIFAIGDIAETDPHRSSARNAGFQLAAKNIDKFLSGKSNGMKAFRAPAKRWGSVLGIQNEGLRLFTPKGSTIPLRPWTVRNIIYPIFVDRMIYRGINRE